MSKKTLGCYVNVLKVKLLILHVALYDKVRYFKKF